MKLYNQFVFWFVITGIIFTSSFVLVRALHKRKSVEIKSVSVTESKSIPEMAREMKKDCKNLDVSNQTECFKNMSNVLNAMLEERYGRVAD